MAASCACGCGQEARASYVKGHNRRGFPFHGKPIPGRPATHGHTGTRTYASWQAMRTRCLNPNCSDWPRYGGRGITICAEWNSFEQFLADLGERPEGMTLDRIDVDGGYDPGNCRWADAKTQRRNQRLAAAA